MHGRRNEDLSKLIQKSLIISEDFINLHCCMLFFHLEFLFIMQRITEDMVIAVCSARCMSLEKSICCCY